MSTSDQENLNPLFSNFPEKEYYQYSSLEKARKLGQYYAASTARFMAEWVNLALRCRGDESAVISIFRR